MDSLKIATYNVKHLEGDCKMRYMLDIFNQCDFMLTQEHWLYESELHRYEQIGINSHVLLTGKSAMDPSVLKVNGRPHGGVCIMWRSNIKYDVRPIETVSNRLACVKINMDAANHILLFNVYMPCDEHSGGTNLCVLQDVLTEIAQTCQSTNSNMFIIICDFNTDFSHNTPQTSELVNYM